MEPVISSQDVRNFEVTRFALAGSQGLFQQAQDEPGARDQIHRTLP